MIALECVLDATGGHLFGPRLPGLVFAGVAADSRLAQPGDLFVALRGERHNGHDFVADAQRRGALAALVEYVPDGLPPGLPLVVVPDCRQALVDLARAWRARHQVTVVGVTGSVGKTTTKETIATVLAERWPVLKSEGNLNTEVGMPLALLRLGPEHRVAVLEMGMFAQGDIRLLAELARPTIGVVTNVQPSHLERLGSIDAIAAAKAELVEALPVEGWAVLNADDPRVSAMAGRTRARVLTYGLGGGADVRASAVESRGLEGLRFTIHHRGERWPISTPLLGTPGLHSALAAAAVGLALGLDGDTIAAGLARASSTARIRVRPAPGGYRVLDDTYNASPSSTLAALDLLAGLEGRKAAALGDMLELGSYEEEAHRVVGRRAAEVCALLATLGPRSRWLAEEARAAGLAADSVFEASDHAEAAAWLTERLRPGDTILVKGSRGMLMEQLVTLLCQSAGSSEQEGASAN